MNTIVELSASDLACRIRDGSLSPLDVVEAYIARIEAVDRLINAVITPMFDQARRDAVQAAEAVQRGDQLGPLHGVPVTIKDCFDVADVRSTTGLTSRSNHVSSTDAVVVRRLREAGAIVLGKTNTPDSCWNQETTNLLFGRTNNPWNLARTVGGSSGGEAAIIAACGSPLGLGSDIAGSIRLPAHFTGIVGLRPTSSTLPEAGNWPPYAGRLAELEAIGPMARRVEDVALAFDVLRGADHQPPAVARLSGKRVAYWFSDGMVPVSGAVQGGVRAAVGALEGVGMIARQSRPAAVRGTVFGWLAHLGPTERQALGVAFGGGERWLVSREIARALIGRGRVHGQALLLWTVAHVGSLLAARMGVNATRWRERLHTQLGEMIGEDGVCISPIFPTTAPRHGWVWRALTLPMNYQTWVNMGGLPGLTVPVGRSANGLPVGVQIVGLPGTERTLLDAGLAVQQALMPRWIGPTLPV